MKALFSVLISITLLFLFMCGGLFFISTPIEKCIVQTYQKHYLPLNSVKSSADSLSFSLQQPLKFNKLILKDLSKQPLFSISIDRIVCPFKLTKIFRPSNKSITTYTTINPQIHFSFQQLFRQNQPHSPALELSSLLTSFIKPLTHFSDIGRWIIQNGSLTFSWNGKQHQILPLEGTCQIDTTIQRLNIDLLVTSHSQKGSLSFSTTLANTKKHYTTLLYQRENTPHSLFIRSLNTDEGTIITLNTNTGIAYNRLQADRSYTPSINHLFYYHSTFYQKKIGTDNWLLSNQWLEVFQFSSLKNIRGHLSGRYSIKKTPYQNIPILANMTAESVSWSLLSLTDLQCQHLIFLNQNILCSSYSAIWKGLKVNGFFKILSQEMNLYLSFKKDNFDFNKSWIVFDLLKALSSFTSSSSIESKIKISLSYKNNNIFYKGFCEIKTFLTLPEKTDPQIKQLFDKKNLHFTFFYSATPQAMHCKAFVLRIENTYYVGKGHYNNKGFFKFKIYPYKKPHHTYILSGHLPSKKIKLESTQPSTPNNIK